MILIFKSIIKKGFFKHFFLFAASKHQEFAFKGTPSAQVVNQKAFHQYDQNGQHN